ncbi:HhH-GPD-type base excision DNA repair protein [Dactylosporangium sp. NPDC006015]|uniref:HhH-GPD-type base excision DNA repair protein n=1 Tax=Dactylosporangium sp. NPDC006015 TaxID=3154576 RepID=UPI0033B36455
MPFSLPIPAEANALLDRDPLALLVGMTLDQQIPLEKAFSSPWVLSQRLGHEPTAQELAEFDPDALVEIFATPPALHRFPKAMAARVQEVCRVLVDRYDGDTAAMWTGVASGGELLRRVQALPGFGKQKAQIFVALLGKQYSVQPDGWREAAGGYGEVGSHRSVADIVDGDSLGKVREFKKQMKAAAKAPGALGRPGS